MTEIPGYALLGRLRDPKDLRALATEQLDALALEMRRYLIETLGRVGGHFAANLGTVELTLALHYSYNTPHDRLIWDVGHQAYPHKIVTGRRSRLETIRRFGGLAQLCAGERRISTSTRNDPGRMGSAEAEIFLGSALTVTASAIAGHICGAGDIAKGRPS